LLESNTNNITGFKDLFNKKVNDGQSHDKRKRNDSTSSKTATKANKQNGVFFPTHSPNKPRFGNKPHTASSSENKDSVRTGKSGGMLANKGGGTLVITAKGSNKGAANGKSWNGNLNGQNKLISNFVPFSGKGYTLGAGSETKGLSYSVKNSALLEDSVHDLGNRTLLAGVTANKRQGSITENEGSKKVKGGSLLDFTSESEKHSAADDNIVKCPVCNSDVRELDVNTHLDSCLGAFFVDDGAAAVEEYSVKSEAHSREVKCPVCNSELLKSDLDDHLNMCLGSVFRNASIDDDDDDDDDVVDDDDNVDEEDDDDDDDDDDDYSGDLQDKRLVDMKAGYSVYPCPCCAVLVTDTEMSIHLDHCLARAQE
jgi:hypothetical protein